MAEYIDREAAVKAFNNFDAGRACSTHSTLLTPEEFAEYLYELPTADVAPVVHGRWLHTDWAYHWTSLDKCSVCDYHDEKRQHLGNYSYCPNCGAKMDGGAEDAAD